jgi:hypothetical protein
VVYLWVDVTTFEAALDPLLLFRLNHAYTRVSLFGRTGYQFVHIQLSLRSSGYVHKRSPFHSPVIVCRSIPFARNLGCLLVLTSNSQHSKSHHISLLLLCRWWLNLDTLGLHTFLSTHSTNLRALRLDLYSDYDHHEWFNPNDRYAQPVFRIALPRLESLELGCGFCTNLEKTAAYVRQYAHSLTVLKFERTHLLFREVEVSKCLRGMVNFGP